ncbi:MAG TPA: hypothetical protein PLT70_07245 [bacterium]|nr:hypothetical protein [bacterium]
MILIKYLVDNDVEMDEPDNIENDLSENPESDELIVENDNTILPDEILTDQDAEMSNPDDEITDPDDEITDPDDEITDPDDEITDPDEMTDPDEIEDSDEYFEHDNDVADDDVADEVIIIEEEEVEDIDDYIGFDEEITNDSELPDDDSFIEAKNILFAHGLNASFDGWSTFRNYAEDQGWTVYGTSVGKRDSIANRADALANYINTLGLEENSLIVVGHSMGGLDLHYIISKGHEDPSSKFGLAASTFKKYYTIASPHKGNQFSGMDLSVLNSIAALDGLDWADMATCDAVHDLGLEQMQEFNEQYPYTTFSINGRKIPAMALRFSCIEGDEKGDGVVAVQNQSLNGAPHTSQIYEGAHMPGVCDILGVEEEQEQTSEILQKILDGYNFPKDVHDIVFYEGADCTGGEKGIFSSRAGITVSCGFYNLSHNDSCDNDEIRSVKIFPGVRKDLNIYVFDEDAGVPVSYDDDWAVINTGSKNLSEAVCINTFEQNTTNDMASKGLSMFYHKGSMSVDGGWLNGKISRIQFSTLKRERIVFYEGFDCEQQVKGYFDTSADAGKKCGTYSGSGTCANDEIKSVLIFPGVADGTITKVYDDSSGSLSDDWFFINRGSKSWGVPFCINGLEHSTSEKEKDAGVATFFRDSGGLIKLNGKVSYIKISRTKDSKFVFYEGPNCEQQVKGLFEAGSTGDTYYEKCEGYSVNGTCDNDEINSLLIQPGVLKGKDVRVYDDSDGTLNDDYTSIYRGQLTLDAPFCINGFEHDTSDRESEAGITVNYHPNNGLNGKISYIKIVDDL